MITDPCTAAIAHDPQKSLQWTFPSSSSQSMLDTFCCSFQLDEAPQLLRSSAHANSRAGAVVRPVLYISPRHQKICPRGSRPGMLPRIGSRGRRGRRVRPAADRLRGAFATSTYVQYSTVHSITDGQRAKVAVRMHTDESSKRLDLKASSRTTERGREVDVEL